MESEESKPDDTPAARLARDSKYVSLARKLKEFLRAKQKTDKISPADSDTVLAVCQEHLVRHGVIPDDPTEMGKAIHDPDRMLAEFAVYRQAYHLMEKRLLELHPEFSPEIAKLRASTLSR